MVNAGVKGFKCFLIHSGVDEFPSVTESDVRMAMKQMQGTDAVFLVCVISSSFHTFLSSAVLDPVSFCYKQNISICSTLKMNSGSGVEHT